MPLRLPEVHQASQAVIAADLSRAVAQYAWPELDPHNIKGTLPRLTVTVMALIHRYGSASSVYAASFYKEQRKAAGVTGRISVPVPPLPSTGQVSKSLDWATSPLYGDASPQDVKHALTNVQGVAERLVLDMSRATVVDAVQQDKEARGWARVPEAGACYFCLLMASRGALYKSKGTAGQIANEKFVGEGKFKFHNHCACHIEPTFSDHYEPTAQVRAAKALYDRTPYGGSAATARNNFRVALQRERDAGRI